jgi:hypothetical protein
VSQHGSPQLKAQVRAKVAKKYPGISQQYGPLKELGKRS